MKESGLRIVEAEEAVRENEAKHQKEVKKLKKEAEKTIENLANQHREYIEKL